MARKRKGKRVDTPDGVRVLNKNANREGSVYQQADGRWCATWWEPGRSRPRKATGKTQEAAITRRAKRQAEAGLNAGELRNLGKLADWWLHNVHKQAVRRSSWAKAEDRVRRIKATLGHLDVVELEHRIVTEWQSDLLTKPQPPRHQPLKPRTVRHHRQTLAQIVDEAVRMRLVVGNAVRSVPPPRIEDSGGVALELDEADALIDAVRQHRLAAAVALLYKQGWRISEVLGLAWEDLDLDDDGTALVQRASVYVDGIGQQLGPTKNEGAQGDHYLMPTVIELLRARRAFQDHERTVAPTWETITYKGQPIHLVFTTPTGGLVLRQTVAKIVKQAAKTAGIAVDISTHTGRRTVVTALFDDGEEDIGDIAEFVGHASPATTAGYVKRRRRRPKAVSQRAAALLDKRPNPPARDQR